MSYAAGESVDLVKSSVGGGNGSTALLDASLANDSSQEWEGNEEDSGSLLRKQKPILQQQQERGSPLELIAKNVSRTGPPSAARRRRGPGEPVAAARNPPLIWC